MKVAYAYSVVQAKNPTAQEEYRNVGVIFLEEISPGRHWQAALRVSGTRLPRPKVLRRIRSLSPGWPISLKTSYEVTVYSSSFRTTLDTEIAKELARAVNYCLSPEGCPRAPSEEKDEGREMRGERNRPYSDEFEFVGGDLA